MSPLPRYTSLRSLRNFSTSLRRLRENPKTPVGALAKADWRVQFARVGRTAGLFFPFVAAFTIVWPVIPWAYGMKKIAKA